MIAWRPSRMTLCLVALGGAALIRGGVAVDEATEPAIPRGVFVAAADAAGAAAPATEPEAAPEPDVASAADEILARGCDMPETLLAAIKEERALLEAQKQKLETRASEVGLAAEELAIETARLTELREELTGLLERVEAAHTADVDRLVGLYAAMKPADAAKIMDDLDLEVSVMVLGTMRERDAAPILAGLNAVRARAISKIILERSQLPGDQDLTGIKLK